jgi:hypothetical protein
MSSAASGASSAPTIAYFTAVWLGMSHDDIARGIAEGRIAAPGAGLPALLSEDGANGAAATSAHGADAQAPLGSSPESVGVPADASAVAEPATDASAVAEPATDAPVPRPARGDLEAILRALDPSLSADAFAPIWDHAGASDDERGSALLSHLSRSLLGPGVAPMNEPATTLTALRESLADGTHRAQVIDLTKRTGAEIAALAATDAGYRAALLDLAPIALVGNAVSHAGFGSGEVARFDPDTGEQRRTDEWLADRAKLLAWKLAGPGAVTGEDTGRWTFFDRSALDGHGQPLRLEVGEGAFGNTVMFGTEDVDVLKGAGGTDRLYGGGGDDLLRGNAGDDLLQGGDGDDVVTGGTGDDDLAGESGDDDLAGGHGADRLRGGAGDDTLEGGAGDDRLEGGAGHDIYVIDSGDGTDTIVDADGAGELQVDGQRLSGGSAVRDGRWWSEDGRTSFAFSGDPAEGGSLAVARYAQAAPDGTPSALPVQTIKLSHWRNGELGLVLGDGSADALGSSAAISSTGAAPAADAQADVPAIPVDAPLDLRVMPGGSGSDGGVLEMARTAAASSAASSVPAAASPVATSVPAEEDRHRPALADAPVDAHATGPVPDVGTAGNDASSGSIDAFFERPSRAESIAGELVAGQHLQAALDVWAQVADAPDIPPASTARAPQVDAAAPMQGESPDLGPAPSVVEHADDDDAMPPDVPTAVTAQDLTAALVDYHDASDLSADPATAFRQPGPDWLQQMQSPSQPTPMRRIDSDPVIV